MSSVAALIPWILPPVLGAIIGYVTNSVAIAMIFRPYEEKRFLGMRIPFTPGIIPKQRKELAVSIGKMVSRELLTEDAVRTQTSAPRFREGLGKSIGNSTSKLLETRFSEIAEKWGNGRDRTAPPGLPALLWELFSNGPGFTLLLDTAIGKALEYVSSLKISALFSNEGSRERFAGTLLDIVSSPDLADKVETWVGRWLDRHVEEDSPLSEVFSEGDVEKILSILDSIYPDVTEKLISYLDRRDVRKELETRGKALIRNAINRFNSFQRFFIMAGQFDRNLEENMDSLVADLIKAVREWLRNEETRKNLISKAGSKIENLRNRGFAEISRDVPDLRARLLNGIGGIFGILRRPGTRNALIRGIEGMESYGGETIGSMFNTIFKSDISSVKGSIVSALLSGKERGGGGFIYPVIDSLLRENGETTLGRFLGIGGGEKDKIDGMAADLVIGVIDTKIPEILNSINVEELVVNKIDSLDIRQMERLIIEVVSKQLQWINIFGGILGAIIGMSQVLLRLFM